MRILSVFLAILAFSLSASAAIHHVPDDFPTIQSAIDDPAVVAGDVVIVRAGVYLENLNFMGKAITLISEEGPENTYINGDQRGSVVTFDQREGQNTILEGFTLTQGKAFNGGGIHCDSSSPTIRNNIISQNAADYLGGGIYCFLCGPVIHENRIEYNEAHRGGAIGMERFSSPVISKNTIQFNFVIWSGAGIISFQSDPRIIDNLFSCNASNKYAGAITGGEFSHMLIVGNTIENNTAAVYAGGILCGSGATCNISNCLITGNTAGIYGGGLFIRRTQSVTISNTIISGNTAFKDGGGIYFTLDFPGPSLVRNCTIYGNEALNTGGGVCSTSSASQCFINTIIRENMAVSHHQVYAAQPAQLDATYCNVQEGWAGQGNIDSDAAFADPANNDFHLTRLSPCINRGTDKDAPHKDMEGDKRPCMGSWDMGIDEFTDTHPLESDLFEVRITTGGSIQFTLDGGIQNSGREYMMLGSNSGTVPDTPLPGNMVNLPLNWDLFTDYVLAHMNTQSFARFNGLLDGNGQGTAHYNTPPLPSSYLGTISHFAFFLVGPPYDFVSNPVAITYIN